MTLVLRKKEDFIMEEEFRTLILKSVEEFEDFKKNYKRKGFFKPIRRPYENSLDKKTNKKILFRRKENGFSYMEWENDQHNGYLAEDYFENKIKNFPEYQLLFEFVGNYSKNIENKIPSLDKISSRFTNSADYALRKLFVRIIYKKIIGELNNKLIDEYLKVFFEEIKLQRWEYYVIHYLTGIYFESNSIKLKSKIKLKYSMLEDFLPVVNFATFDHLLKINASKFIAIYSTKTSDEKEINKIDRDLSSALSLFSPRSTYTEERFIFKKTVIGRHYLKHQVNYLNSYNNNLVIKKRDEKHFVSFINEIIESFHNLDEDDYRYIYIALEKYSWALKEESLDKKILYAIMGLESLFILSKERGPKSERLMERITHLLFFYSKSKINKTTIKKAYDFRNIIAHGGIYPKDWRKGFKVICTNIIQYLRISLIFILLSKKLKKADMIEFLNENNNTLEKVEFKKRILENQTKFQIYLD